MEKRTEATRFIAAEQPVVQMLAAVAAQPLPMAIVRPGDIAVERHSHVDHNLAHRESHTWGGPGAVRCRRAQPARTCFTRVSDGPPVRRLLRQSALHCCTTLTVTLASMRTRLTTDSGRINQARVQPGRC